MASWPPLTPSGWDFLKEESEVSSMDLPIVGNLVDLVVPRIEHNPIVDRLPKWIQGLWALAFSLCIEAAAFLVSAMAFAGALYYGFPSVANALAHRLVAPNDYWAYVILMLGGATAFAALKAMWHGHRADVLSEKKEREASIKALIVPVALLLALLFRHLRRPVEARRRAEGGGRWLPPPGGRRRSLWTTNPPHKSPSSEGLSNFI
jgi:hypothetical protein